MTERKIPDSHESGLFFSSGLKPDVDLRPNLFQPLENTVCHFFLVDDEVGKLIFSVHKNNAVIVIGRAVIRLAFTDANEAAVDVVIGNVIVLSKIAVIQRELTEAYARELPKTLMSVLVIMGPSVTSDLSGPRSLRVLRPKIIHGLLSCAASGGPSRTTWSCRESGAR